MTVITVSSRKATTTPSGGTVIEGPDGVRVCGRIYSDGSGSLALVGPGFTGTPDAMPLINARLNAVSGRAEWVFTPPDAHAYSFRYDQYKGGSTKWWGDLGRRHFPQRWGAKFDLFFAPGVVKEALSRRDYRLLLRPENEDREEACRRFIHHVCGHEGSGFVRGPKTTVQWRKVLAGAGFVDPKERLSKVAEFLAFHGLERRLDPLYIVWRKETSHYTTGRMDANRAPRTRFNMMLYAARFYPNALKTEQHFGHFGATVSKVIRHAKLPDVWTPEGGA